MSDASLCVRFGDDGALILCDDRDLRRSLHRHFRHCLGDKAPPVATYRAALDDDQAVRLSRGDELLYHGSKFPHLIQCLMQHLTTDLTEHCQKYLVFHAAGLAKGRYGLILCGGSGSGKSTLAAWLTACGLDFLTDELVAVSLDLSEMRGLARPIGLKEGSAFVWERWLNEASRQDLIRLSNESVLLDPELLRPRCVRSSARPQIVVFPRYTAGEPFTAQRLSPAEALFLLMQRLVNARNLPDLGFTAATRLAHRTTSYSLAYSDVSEAAAWIEQLSTQSSVQ
jgi:hypothetical protein